MSWFWIIIVCSCCYSKYAHRAQIFALVVSHSTRTIPRPTSTGPLTVYMFMYEPLYGLPIGLLHINSSRFVIGSLWVLVEAPMVVTNPPGFNTLTPLPTWWNGAFIGDVSRGCLHSFWFCSWMKYWALVISLWNLSGLISLIHQVSSTVSATPGTRFSVYLSSKGYSVSRIGNQLPIIGLYTQDSWPPMAGHWYEEIFDCPAHLCRKSSSPLCPGLSPWRNAFILRSTKHHAHVVRKILCGTAEEIARSTKVGMISSRLLKPMNKAAHTESAMCIVLVSYAQGLVQVWQVSSIVIRHFFEIWSRLSAYARPSEDKSCFLYFCGVLASISYKQTIRSVPHTTAAYSAWDPIYPQIPICSMHGLHGMTPSHCWLHFPFSLYGTLRMLLVLRPPKASLHFHYIYIFKCHALAIQIPNSTPLLSNTCSPPRQYG